MSDRAGAWDSTYHAPVLVREVTVALGPTPTVLDGTLGGGGHSAALLAEGHRVFAVDRDPEAVAAARARLADQAGTGRFQAFVANFAALDAVPELRGIAFDGVLLDLGVSSHQLDDLARGFSFRRGAPLDMRMSREEEPPVEPVTGRERPDALPEDSAAGFLNSADEAELATVFRDYGDEPRAGRLAREIVRRRQSGTFSTSDDLVAAIRGALGARTGPGDFARLFQAVRIAVNDELQALGSALPALRDRLTPGGRLAVISYHSGEDRLVKRAFRDWSLACRCPPRQPQCTCGGRALGSLLTRKPIVPDEAEIGANSRARSAKLRLWQRAA